MFCSVYRAAVSVVVLIGMGHRFDLSTIDEDKLTIISNAVADGALRCPSIPTTNSNSGATTLDVCLPLHLIYAALAPALALRRIPHVHRHHNKSNYHQDGTMANGAAKAMPEGSSALENGDPAGETTPVPPQQREMASSQPLAAASNSAATLSFLAPADGSSDDSALPSLSASGGLASGGETLWTQPIFVSSEPNVEFIPYPCTDFGFSDLGFGFSGVGGDINEIGYDSITGRDIGCYGSHRDR